MRYYWMGSIDPKRFGGGTDAPLGVFAYLGCASDDAGVFGPQQDAGRARAVGGCADRHRPSGAGVFRSHNVHVSRPSQLEAGAKKPERMAIRPPSASADRPPLGCARRPPGRRSSGDAPRRPGSLGQGIHVEIGRRERTGCGAGQGGRSLQSSFRGGGTRWTGGMSGSRSWQHSQYHSPSLARVSFSGGR